MQLKISSPAKAIYQGEVTKITLPTESGNITINAEQKPMVTAIKPGIVVISPLNKPEGEYIISNNDIYISISKGMAFIDGKIIRIVTASATTSPKESVAVLQKMKEDLEEKINQLKKAGSIEDIEKSLIKLEKINADISLEHLHKKS